MKILPLILITALTLFQTAYAYGPSKTYGPYNAEVTRIIDGDTIAVNAQIFPHLNATLNVRIAGVDTPELRGKCDYEKLLAQQAKRWVEQEFPPGTWVIIRNVRDDKYSGRVVADVYRADDENLGEMLLAAGQAVEYDGTGLRQDWCP